MIEDSGCQRLASVRCNRSYLLLIRIKSEGDAILIGHPEIAIESFLQFSGAFPECDSIRDPTLDDRQNGHNLLCSEPVSLNLACCHGSIDLGSVCIHDGVFSIAPALMVWTTRRKSFVFEIAIAVDIAAVSGPIEDTPPYIVMFTKQPPVSTPCIQLC